MSICKKFYAVVFVLFTSLAQAKAGIVHYAEWDPNYRAYGASFDSVVAVLGHDSNGVAWFIGSGVVVQNNYTVLLSGHQIVNNPYHSYSVRSGTNLFNDVTGIYHTNLSPIVHPTWNGSRMTGLDLAILQFETPILSVTPAMMYTGDHILGADYSMVGWGGFGVPGSTELDYDLQKRGGINVLDNASYLSGDYLNAFFRQPGHPNFRELGMLATPGHSGGGWFIEDNGSFYLAGISSAGGGSSYGLSSTAAKLDHGWINSNLGSAVPEPSSFLLCAIGSLGFLLRRNRR